MWWGHAGHEAWHHVVGPCRDLKRGHEEGTAEFMNLRFSCIIGYGHSMGCGEGTAWDAVRVPGAGLGTMQGAGRVLCGEADMHGGIQRVGKG